jgi:hypothetical protein
MKTSDGKAGQALMWNGTNLEWKDITIYKIQQQRLERKKKLIKISKLNANKY